MINVLLADHAVEIVADRGIHAKAGNARWDAICQEMRTDALNGIAAVASEIAKHFPPEGAGANELLNAPVLLT